ncbi:Tyrosine recombinase XerD [Burkholderia multivorans]|nr:Tyrosine recombinase XerD [Burkholderia multivorans]MDR8771630.1 Tyrosine recombinase XerD [Burkholderia multivorans]MDR8790437.1 Tyrosine recombinase XerD [Burkholderia multivorans]MDR8794291.1 Tyrosine recombinase XerD [Burkholderia multivorans]MDR8801357.1 Tyrosine recombinase XerD [Burkholderia multivorans]
MSIAGRPRADPEPLENPPRHLAVHVLVDVHLPNSVDRALEPRIGNCTMFVVRYIQAMLGHADIKTTQVYTRVSIHALKDIHTATHPARLARTVRNPTDPTGRRRRRPIYWPSLTTRPTPNPAACKTGAPCA